MSLHETRRLFNNFAFLTGGYFLTRLLTMIATLYATRVLGPDNFGTLSFGLNVALVLSVCANLGVDSYLVLAIARSPQEGKAVLGDAMIVKTIVFPLALLVMVLLSWYDPQASFLFFLWMVYSLLHSYLILFWAAFRGAERMEFQTLLMTAEALLLAIGEILAVWLTRNTTIITVAYLASTFLAAVGGYILLCKTGFQPEYRWRPEAWKRLLKAAVPFSLVFIYLIVFDKLPSLSITFLSGKTASGWFNSVYNVLIVLTTIPSIVMSTVFPYLARKSQNDQQSAEDISTNLLKYTTIIGVGVGIVFFILAPVLVPLLFGEAYLPSIWILQVLSIGIPCLFLGLILVNVIEAVGEQTICARYALYVLLASSPVTLFLVWRWGYFGGALAYVINNVFLVVVMVSLARKKVGNIHLGRAFLAPGLAGLGAAVAIYLLQSWSFYLVLIVAVLVYLVLLVVTGAIGSLEVVTVRRVLQSRHGAPASETSTHPVGPYSPE